MTTLQDLIDFAKANDLNPSECTLLYGEECDDGDIQYDYLYNLKVVKKVQAVNHDDVYETVPVGLVMEILEW